MEWVAKQVAVENSISYRLICTWQVTDYYTAILLFMYWYLLGLNMVQWKKRVTCGSRRLVSLERLYVLQGSAKKFILNFICNIIFLKPQLQGNVPLHKIWTVN